VTSFVRVWPRPELEIHGGRYRRVVQTWSDAMASALYGPDGFYRSTSPEQHFRTSANASTLLAESLATLVASVDRALGHPSRLDLVDVGTGDGQLLADTCSLVPVELCERLAPLGVEVRPRPPSLSSTVGWTDTLPAHLTGLVIAHEYLDNVPCDVVEVTEGARLSVVEVEPTSGEEFTPHTPSDQQSAWMAEWWPLGEPGDRAEIGIERDAAWSKVMGALDRGVGVAIDYGHIASERASGRYGPGTLTGYRDGHQVIPIPDGSCDITAHVAVDACASAGVAAGADSTVLMRQADVLRALGLNAQRPPLDLARSDPAAYVHALSRASQAVELLDPSSLGGFWWLLQAKGCTPDLKEIEWIQR